MSGVRITGEGNWNKLTNLRTLEWLRGYHDQVSPKGIKHLTNLTILFLENVYFYPNDLRHLTNLTALSCGNNISHGIYQSFPFLKELHTMDGILDNIGEKPLTQLTNLAITNCYSIPSYNLFRKLSLRSISLTFVNRGLLMRNELALLRKAFQQNYVSCEFSFTG
jgi:hypothetical protein